MKSKIAHLQMIQARHHANGWKFVSPDKSPQEPRLPLGGLHCTKERLRNDPAPHEFSRTWALQNRIAVSI